MAKTKIRCIVLSALLVAVTADKHPSYPQPYQPTIAYREVCTQKEWSSDSELCMPPLEQDCEHDEFQIHKKVREAPKCSTLQIPKCKVINKAENIDICSLKVDTSERDLNAKMYTQEMKKKCQTHYVTECVPGYGRYAKPRCTTVPAQTCYDLPVLIKKNVPIKVRLTTVEEKCENTAVPTPTSKCEDEDFESCLSLTTLKEDKQNVYKCSIKTGDDDECQKVRLTIPREFCYHVKQSYSPYKA